MVVLLNNKKNKKKGAFYLPRSRAQNLWT